MAGMVRISWWKVQAKRKSGRPVEWLPNRNEAGTDMPSTCSPGKSSSHDAPLLPALAILGAVTFLGLGTSWAKHSLFSLVGAQGATAVRVGFCAVLRLPLWRP
jgi:hypothetical protein